MRKCSFPVLYLLVFLFFAVSHAFAQASKPASSDWDRQINELVNQIDAEIPAQAGRVKIAVVDFSDLQGRVTNFGRFLSEELITRLFRLKKFTVVERLLLENVIKENALQLTGMVDPKSAVELGRILGVKAIVSGTISDLGSSLRVNARIISTETGEVSAAANITITKDETVKKLMGETIPDNEPGTPGDEPRAQSSLPGGEPGLKGEYYNLPPFEGSPSIPTGSPTLTRIDRTIDFSWGWDSPAPKISADYFYVRWIGKIYIETTGTYEFRIWGETQYTEDVDWGTDMGIRLIIGKQSIVERWSNKTGTGLGGNIFLQGNQWYSIQLEVFDEQRDAYCRLKWKPPGQSKFSVVSSTVLRTE